MNYELVETLRVVYLGHFVERSDSSLGGGIWAVRPAAFEVVESVGNVTINESFRGQRYLSILSIYVEHVTDVHINVGANALGDDNLIFIFDCDDRHSTLC
jgi:hypothetical protein